MNKYLFSPIFWLSVCLILYFKNYAKISMLLTMLQSYVYFFLAFITIPLQ